MAFGVLYLQISDRLGISLGWPATSTNGERQRENGTHIQKHEYTLLKDDLP
jgi:hypothetical protein